MGGLICFAETARQWRRTPRVGASLLAMVANDYAPCLNERGAFASIASRLAPTRSWALLPSIHYNFVIKLLVGCPDRLVNLSSLPGQPSAVTLPL